MGCCGAKAGAGIDDEVKNKTLIDKAKTPSSSAPLEDEQGGNDDDRDPPRLEEEDEDDLIGLRAVEPLRPVSPAALRSPTKASAMPVPLSPSPSPKVQSASTDKDAEQVQEAPQSPLTKSPIWGRLLPQSPSASTPKASLVAASPISPKATTQEGTPRDEDLVDEVEEEAVATPASVSAVVESDDGVKAFLAALELGVVVVKHDRKGKSKKRELYTADMVTFSWREPSSGTKKPGHERARSGGGMFEKDRAHYYFEDILEVRRGTMLDPQSSKGETGTPVLRAACDPKDYFKSFSLMLKDRSVDLTCHSIEQMTFLIKGFHAIVAQCKKKRRS